MTPRVERHQLVPMPDPLLGRVARAAAQALTQLRHLEVTGQLERAAAALAEADAIHVLGQRQDFPVAAYLAYALGQLDVRSRLLTGLAGATLTQASIIGGREVLLAVGSAPYSQELMAAAHRADERGIAIVALTDGPLSPLIPLALVSLEAREADMAGVATLSATMCLALALVVHLGQCLAQRQPRSARSALATATTSRP